jgi:hypothetical protein
LGSLDVFFEVFLIGFYGLLQERAVLGYLSSLKFHNYVICIDYRT